MARGTEDRCLPGEPVRLNRGVGGHGWGVSSIGTENRHKPAIALLRRLVLRSRSLPQRIQIGLDPQETLVNDRKAEDDSREREAAEAEQQRLFGFVQPAEPDRRASRR